MSSVTATHHSRRRKGALLSASFAALLVLTPMAGVSASGVSAFAAPVPSGSEMSLAKTQFTVGDQITITYRTDAPHAENWIGIYPNTIAPAQQPSSAWDYTPEAAGSLTLSLDLPPGDYDAWLLAKGGYDAFGEKVSFTIVDDPTAPKPGDPNAPVEIDPVVTDVTTDGVIMREDFGGTSAPAGWQISFDDSMSQVGNPDYRGWQFTTRADWSRTVDQMRDRFGRTHDTFAVADAQQFGAHPFTATLTSAPVDVSEVGAVGLTFDSHYRGAAGQAGVVRASFDGAAPVEVLRLDSATVTDGYDGMEMNASHTVQVPVPSHARSVVFSWELTGGADARYWAIDSPRAHRVLLDAENTPTQAWVVSDIQGHPHDFQTGIGEFTKLSPNADGLLMVGDIVNSGTVPEWKEIYDVMDATKDVRPRQTVAAIGNHERHSGEGFGVHFQRFLDFAERDKAWGEYVLEGPAGDQPVIVLGQEFAGPSDVPMSEAQVRFLEDRLAHWTAKNKQVVIMSHYPLGNTVSGSWIPWYSTHHQHNDRLTSILGNYPNAIILTGHTHYPAMLGDWAMQRRTADGHPDGFWAVNTLAMHIGWDADGENTATIGEVTTGDVNRGLTLDSYGDRVVITAHDFATNQQVRQVTIANPLVPFAGVMAPDKGRSADFTAVDAAVKAIPADLSAFTDASVAALNAAVAAVDRTFTADRQAEVDAMAAAIRDAVAGLIAKPDAVIPGGDTTPAAETKPSADTKPSVDAGASHTGTLPRTGAELGSVMLVAAFGLITAGGAVFAVRRRAARN